MYILNIQSKHFLREIAGRIRSWQRRLLSPAAGAAAPPDIAFAWLLRLRWGAVAAQVVFFSGVVFFFGLKLPLAVIFAILGFAAASNIFFTLLHQKSGRCPEPLFALVIALDILATTVLLTSTGGMMNPFSFLYLVHVVLAAMLLSPLWAWGLTGLAALSYASIFVLEKSRWLTDFFLAGHESGHDCAAGPPLHGQDDFSLHLLGMWFAFTITAVFVVHFVGRIRAALSRHQATLDALADEKSKGERLAALATLAAGAAHEFATPLSLIAVASREMVRQLEKNGDQPELLADALLVRAQVDECKDILSQMAADAGQHPGEAPQSLPLCALLRQTGDAFAARYRVRVTYDCGAGDAVIHMPPKSLGRTVGALLKNGLDASPADSVLTIGCFLDAKHVRITVTDQGGGMDAATLEKAMDPFFSTKEAGKGMGLGLFLARSLAERFGGGLSLTSVPGQGTTVTLSLARAAVGGNQAGV